LNKLCAHEKIRALLKAVWCMLLWLVLLFMLSRLTMFHSYAAADDLYGYEQDILRMWVTGLRYDARVCAIMLMPVFALGLLASVSGKTWRLFMLPAKLLFALASFTAALFAIANYYYYQTFHNYIDIFIFGFLSGGEDTGAVLQNIWQDYPVIPICLALVLLSILPALLVLRILTNSGQTRNHAGSGLRPCFFYAALLVNMILFFLIARGGLGTFPLNRNSAQISNLEELNKLTPNGLITLYWAGKDYLRDETFTMVEEAQGRELLRRAGFSSLMETTRANSWLAGHKPHVALVIMESFGSNMLAMDHPTENDLLGSLRAHFDSGFLFPRFLPEGNGTAPSLAALLFLSPVQNISHSTSQKKALSHTPFRVYKDAGYTTVFIHPGNMMWRNMAGYLPLQGVDRAYDQNDLLKLYPEADKDLTAWGVPDEYAYRLLETLLLESPEPLFAVVLTTTNHPPYHTPSTYMPKPLRITEDMLKNFEDDAKYSLQMLETFQYAADALGAFISRVKNSPVGGKTVLAATGDHQMRRLLHYSTAEQALRLSVPFYLPIPEKILLHTSWTYERTRPASHKDILPTLYSHSLPETRYLALGGRDLLTPVDDPQRSFGYNTNLWITAEGAFFYGKKAWTMLPWEEKPPASNSVDNYSPAQLLLLANKTSAPTPEQAEKMSAYPELLRWQINARVNAQTVEIDLAE
jgi:phosphoglycerol transferase MdoB-like AlkP superfamily enzyme